MANISISTRQNIPDNIQRLAAQRRLYTVAKRIAAVQASLATATPLGAAVVVAINPAAAIWSALAGILVPILDIGFLDPRQKQLRERAAGIQDEFDCAVLDLPWNEALTGSRPAPEDMHEAARKNVPSEKAPLENWYPIAVGALPLYQGRIICQRTNCWWDAKLRRRYAVGIGMTISVISILVLMLGLLNGMTLEKFVLAVLAPLSPAILWGLREIRRQTHSASALDRLKDYGRAMWQRCVSGTLAENEATQLSRQLQDAIFYRRRDSPFVFDWIYRRLQKDYEEQMNVGAEAMVREIQGRR